MVQYDNSATAFDVVPLTRDVELIVVRPPKTKSDRARDGDARVQRRGREGRLPPDKHHLVRTRGRNSAVDTTERPTARRAAGATRPVRRRSSGRSPCFEGSRAARLGPLVSVKDHGVVRVADPDGGSRTSRRPQRGQGPTGARPGTTSYRRADTSVANAPRRPDVPATQDDWLIIHLVGALLVLTSVLVFPAIVLNGYLVRVLRESGEPDPRLPAFTDWGELFVDGLKFATVNLAYGAVFLVPYALLLALLAGDGANPAGSVAVALGALVFLVGFALAA